MVSQGLRRSYMPEPREETVTPPNQPYLRAVGRGDPATNFERPPNVPYPEGRQELAQRRYEAAIAHSAPRVPWDVFSKVFRWEQGEHVGIIGPNGQGKTTLLIALLPFRRYVTVFATKPIDRTLDSLAEQGDYTILPEWLRIPAEKMPRRILWPDARDIDAENTQQKIFDHAFKSIFREGGWTTVIDEGWYMSEVLGQKARMRANWTQGRSLGLSFVVGTQRPAWVPLEMYDGSTHLFIYRVTEKAAVDRLSNLGAADPELAKRLIRGLEKHQFLYVNTRTGEMLRSRAPAPKYDQHDTGTREEVNNTRDYA